MCRLFRERLCREFSEPTYAKNVSCYEWWTCRRANRQTLLRSLCPSNSMTTAEIKDIVHIPRGELYHTLREMEEKGLIERIPPGQRYGAIYRPTDLGRLVFPRVAAHRFVQKARRALGDAHRLKISQGVKKALEQVKRGVRPPPRRVKRQK